MDLFKRNPFKNVQFKKLGLKYLQQKKPNINKTRRVEAMNRKQIKKYLVYN